MSNDTLPPSTPIGRRNRGTQLPPARGPRISQVRLADIHAFACEKMSKALPAAAGYRLYWTRGDEVQWMDLPIGGAYAILGRHSECDAILARDPTLSLRHLLATTVTLSDGIGFRLFDLQTAVPFFLSDSTPQRSVLVFGSMAARVGEYVVGAVPIEETAAGLRAVLGALPAAEVVEALEAPRSVAQASSHFAPPVEPAAVAGSPYRDAIPRKTMINSMRPPSSIVELRHPAIDEDAPLPECTFARVTLTRGYQRAAVDLTETQLELGVLIGRADRCLDEGLRAVLNETISRGHVLLLRDHRGLEAFDLCSTQGTLQDRKRVRRVVFTSASSALVMGRTMPVELHVRLRDRAPLLG